MQLQASRKSNQQKNQRKFLLIFQLKMVLKFLLIVKPAMHSSEGESGIILDYAVLSVHEIQKPNVQQRPFPRHIPK